VAAATTIDQVEQKTIDELGLRRIDTSELVIERIAANGSFDFLVEGKRVGRRDRKRISELTIPPAWSEVRIAGDRDAHLQAVGRDEAGRLQYIYHSAWEDVRAAAKAFRLIHMGQGLPRLRSAIENEMKRGADTFPLAVAARLVDVLHLRAGHENYAGDEGGRGVATLLKRHLEIDGASFQLKFRGKGGKKIEKTKTDATLADALAELRRVRGPRLFKRRTNEGYRPMTAIDLNAYVAEKSGKPITVKDFRTLYASAGALDHFLHIGRVGKAACRRAVAEVARQIGNELANTPAVVRKSYIQPQIIEKFERGELTGMPDAHTRAGLTPEESKLMRFLEQAHRQE
jgi:DNA topoisomerase-1